MALAKHKFPLLIKPLGTILGGLKEVSLEERRVARDLGEVGGIGMYCCMGWRGGVADDDDWDFKRSAQDFLGGGITGARGTTGDATVAVAVGDSLDWGTGVEVAAGAVSESETVVTVVVGDKGASKGEDCVEEAVVEFGGIIGTASFFLGIDVEGEGGEASVLLLVGVEGIDSAPAFDIGIDSSTRLEIDVESDSEDSSDGMMPGGGCAKGPKERAGASEGGGGLNLRVRGAEVAGEEG